MDHQVYKEVYFHEYCKKCRYEKTKETEEPCSGCMSEALNWNSHKPVKYKEKKKETTR